MFFASKTYTLGALGGRSHFLRFQRVTKACQTIKCISNPISALSGGAAMTSPTKAPPLLRTGRGATGLHQASDRRWLLQTFLWPSQILSSIETRDQFLRPIGAPPAGPLKKLDTAGGGVRYDLVERHRATTDAALGP
jgi:hypothetical protein